MKPLDEKDRMALVSEKPKSSIRTMGLLRTDEKNFLQDYWKQYFDNLRRNETRSMVTGVLDKHPSITRFLRAHLVDWLFHVCHVLPKDDYTLPFITIKMLDRFFC